LGFEVPRRIGRPTNNEQLQVAPAFTGWQEESRAAAKRREKLSFPLLHEHVPCLFAAMPDLPSRSPRTFPEHCQTSAAGSFSGRASPTRNFCYAACGKGCSINQKPERWLKVAVAVRKETS
jgi:hypothetical protein